MKKRILFLAVTIILISFPGSSLFAQKVDRSAPPKLPAISKLNLAPIQKFQLSNGVKVVLMEKHEVPLMQLNVMVRAGNVNDPENKVGLASLTLDMMDEGAAGKNSLELSDAIDFLGVRISTNSGVNYSQASLHSPLSKFNDALKILADIVLRPDFPAKELERKKKDRLTSLMQMHDQPIAIAGAAFNQIIFGKEHPYGRMTNETAIKGFTVDDLKNFYNKYFKASNAVIVAVGDIKKDVLKEELEKAFGKWQKGEVKDQKVADAPQVVNRVVYIIDKPGAAQSVISIGRIGTSRSTPDYFPITIMNTILGGSFSSRLNQNLREKNGYTYGARSGFAFRESAGSFSAVSSVQTEVTDKALTEFFNELNGISQPIPAEDISRGKNYVALGYPGNFQAVQEIAGELSEMVQFNLPESYFDDYVSNMLNVSGDEVQRVAKKYIVTDQMAIIVVGDRAKIEDGIKKLNLGEVLNLTVEDVLGKVPKLDN